MAKSKADQFQAKRADKQGSQQSAQQMAGQSPSSAIELLKQDHRKVEQLFEQFDEADDESRQRELAQQICKELMVHATIEEEIFYPACRTAAGEDEKRSEALDEAQVEHDTAKILINEILQGGPDDPYWKAKVSVLCDQIEHHVEEEEKPGDGIMAKAQSSGIDTADLASRLMRRKSELQGRAADLRPIRAVSFHQPSHQEEGMPRYYGPERDERGRFMSDDDRDYRRSRSRYEDDDDDRRGRGGGHGGWFGDSRGHAEAARQRWEERRGPGYYEDDDRDYRRSRSRYDEDDDDRRGRGEYGGWFGDPRGHAEAARRGWEERRGSRYEDDDDRYYRRSRSRYDEDDDDRRGRSDHGGWFGDPRGHAEAARRGWRERR
jgi:hemerythrin superfamily protein